MTNLDNHLLDDFGNLTISELDYDSNSVQAQLNFKRNEAFSFIEKALDI